MKSTLCQVLNLKLIKEPASQLFETIFPGWLSRAFLWPLHTHTQIRTYIGTYIRHTYVRQATISRRVIYVLFQMCHQRDVNVSNRNVFASPKTSIVSPRHSRRFCSITLMAGNHKWDEMARSSEACRMLRYRKLRRRNGRVQLFILREFQILFISKTYVDMETVWQSCAGLPDDLF
jgi:hypothetical protein